MSDKYIASRIVIEAVENGFTVDLFKAGYGARFVGCSRDQLLEIMLMVDLRPEGLDLSNEKGLSKAPERGATIRFDRTRDLAEPSSPDRPQAERAR